MATIQQLGLGVAAPLANHNFAEPTYVDTKLNGALTVGATSVTVDPTGLYYQSIYNDNPMDIDQVFMGGDLIEIGPSSDSAFQGFSEIATISSVSGNVITLTTGTEFPFDSGDKVIGFGRAIGAGWYSLNNPTMLGISSLPPKPYTVAHSLSNYLGNMNYQKLSATTADIEELEQPKTFSIVYELAATGDKITRALLASTVYRYGVYYRVGVGANADFSLDNNPNDGPFFGVSDGEITFINNVLLTRFHLLSSGQSLSSWHLATGFGTTEPFDNYGDQLVTIGIKITKPNSFEVDDQLSATMDINSYFLQHAKISDGEDVGMYFFTSDGTSSGVPISPDIGKSWQHFNVSKSIRLVEGFSQNYNIKGLNGKRWRVDLRYTRVPESFLKNLDVFLTWQRNGHSLVLHTGEDHTQVSTELTGSTEVADSGLPPFIVGKLQVNGSNRPLTDLTLKNLTITFIEENHGFRHQIR